MNAPDSNIEVLKNNRSGKLFVIVDDRHADKVKVINPLGKSMFMPWDLFDDETIYLNADEAQEQLSAEQLEALETLNEQALLQVEMQAKAQTRKLNEPKAASVPRPRNSSSSKPRKNPKEHMRGLAASWKSARLTFYRHHIEPLGPNQSFRIDIDGFGTIQMTRQEFQTAFNDVVMSSSYRSDGIYSYEQVPEKARRFLRS